MKQIGQGFAAEKLWLRYCYILLYKFVFDRRQEAVIKVYILFTYRYFK